MRWLSMLSARKCTASLTRIPVPHMVLKMPHPKPKRPGSNFRRLRTELGATKAITAMAHKLARLIYRMMKFGTEYVARNGGIRIKIPPTTDEMALKQALR